MVISGDGPIAVIIDRIEREDQFTYEHRIKCECGAIYRCAICIRSPKPILQKRGGGMSSAEFRRLIKDLRHSDPNMRRQALESLSELGDEQAVQPISALLSDPNTEVSIAAVKALERIGGQAAIKALVRALVEEDRFFYDDYEPGIHSSEYPQHALERIGRPAVPELVKALDNEAWVGRTVRSGRWRAAWTLGELGDAVAVPGLIEALDKVGDDVRPSVASALGKIGDAAAVPHLIKRLQEDPVAKVREWSAFALRRIADVTSVPALIATALADPSPAVRGASINALYEIGDAAAVPALTQMLKDDDVWVRSRAAAALEHIGTAEAIRALAAWRELQRN
jgi:HEAT repeat protein